MLPSVYQIGQFRQFYRAAVTKYQVHSPFVFEFVQNVLEDKRPYYAFGEVEALRWRMQRGHTAIDFTDWNEQATAGSKTPPIRRIPLKTLVGRAASSPAQGRRLFRLVNWLKPMRSLEIGGSVGIGTMYLAAAARPAPLISLEGCSQCAAVARMNLDLLHLDNAEVVEGPFEKTLAPALKKLQTLDFVFFDGNHFQAPTLRYFEDCLPHAGPGAAFVFDDIYRSPGMTAAWRSIQQHPKVRLTIDCFQLGIAFFNPDFRERQHFRVVPAAWKPWKLF